MARARDLDGPDDQSPEPGGAGGEAGGALRGHRLVDAALVVALVVAIAAIVATQVQRSRVQRELRAASQQVEQLKQSAQAGEEVARQVLEKVRRHMVVPEDPQPTVATIVNADDLKRQNEFYRPAENGDHLIITRTRAILYDPDSDRILDVVPVQIEPPASPSPSPSPSPTASPSPSP